MRNFTLLLAILTFIFQSSSAQVLQFEDFNTGVQPVGWTVTNTGAGGINVGNCQDGITVFSFDCQDYPAAAGAPIPPGFNGTVAVIDYNNLPGLIDPNTVGCHVSPVVNASTATNLALSFDYEHEDFNGDGLFTVEVFDGADWQMVFSAEEDESGHQLIDVSVYANADFQVRYCFDTQSEAGEFIWGCAIDNHQVENIICSQAENLVATDIKSTGATISWTDPNMPEGLSYDLEIVVSGIPPTGIATHTNVSNPYIWSGATAGVTYDVYVRINCSEVPANWAGPLTFLAQDPPANDVCLDAIVVEVGEGMCGPVANGDNTYGGDSGEDTPSCGFYQGGDIWYSFVAPVSGSVLLTLLTETWTNPYVGVYFGSCGDLQEVYCSLVLVSFGEVITGLNPGETYYIRWWDSNNNNFGPISFCLESGILPVNDLCTDAVLVEVGPLDTCGPVVIGDNTFASDSGEELPSCGSYAGGDLWFGFEVPATGSVFVHVNAEEWTSPFAAVYDGDCGSLVELECAMLLSGVDVEFSGLTPGDTVRLRLWDSDNNNFGSIEFCLETAPLPPANDSCANAVALTVHDYSSCPDSAVAGTTIGASDDGFSSCDGFGMNNGVWYTFVAPAEGIVNLQILELTGNHEVAIFDTCEGNEVYCNPAPDDVLVSGLLAGETYYLLVWSDAGNEGNHGICLQEPPPPPSNDSCANAEIVEVGPGVCGTPASGNNTLATDSGEGDPSCGSYAGGDIWYAFNAPTTGGILFQLLLNEWTSPYMAVYSGACGALVELYCDEVNADTLEEITGLNDGEMYFIRLWDSGNDNFGNIEFCLRAVPPPITNDTCTTALGLTVEAYGDCPGNAVLGTTVSATAEGNVSCDSSGVNNGIWYSFAAPADSTIQFQLMTLSGSHKIAIFDSCGGNELYCDTLPGDGIVEGLEPDSTYLILIWSDAGVEGYFEFCLNLPPPLPLNDLCPTATEINAPGPGVYPAFGTTLGATSTDAPAACDPAVDNTTTGGVWYLVTTDSMFDVTIQVCIADFDTELSVYGGECGELICIDSDDDSCDGPNALGSSIVFPAGTFPDSLYVYVSGHGANAGGFTIEVIIEEPLPLQLISFAARSEQFGNVLNWVTAQEQNTEVHQVQILTNTMDVPWETIGKIDAAGFSSSVVEYEWIDENPQARSAYRIATRDFDGTEHYSPIVTVYRDQSHEKLQLLKLYPQPSDSKVVFVEIFNPVAGQLKHEIIDIQGRSLSNGNHNIGDGYQTLALPIQELGAGIYILRLQKDDATIVQKLIVE